MTYLNEFFQKKHIAIMIIFGMLSVSQIMAGDLEQDTFKSSGGEVSITFIGHASLMLEYNDMVIHIDPSLREDNYVSLKDADLILLTHNHGDHMDKGAIQKILKDNTSIIYTKKCADALKDLKNAQILENGDNTEFKNIVIEAVPAYNLVHMRSEGQPFHSKGDGNGYILTFGDMKIYVAGDTENHPEMKALKDIDIAFLPMNLPYTMTPEMVADAAKAFRPKILYPYHYGETDTSKLVGLLKGEKDIEVRLRKM